MRRKSFVFYQSWYEALKFLPKEERRDALTAIVEYGLYGETIATVKPTAMAILEMARVQIDVNNLRYINGCHGGAPQGNHNNPNGRRGKGGASGTESTENQPNENEDEDDNENKNDNNCRRINSSMSKTFVFDDEFESIKRKVIDQEDEFLENIMAARTGKEVKQKGGRYMEIIRYYNNQIVTHKARLRSCRIISEKRKRLILARLNDCGEEIVRKTIDNAIASSFLNYEASNAPVSIDWIMRPDNFARIYEGKYVNRPPRPAQSRNSRYYDPIDNKHINDKWK